MSRIAALMLLAAVWPCGAMAADLPPLPTIPQIPTPAAHETLAAPASAVADRVLGTLRVRTGIAMASLTIGEMPAPVAESQTCASDVRPCGGSIVPGSPVKQWLCFRPTTAHALPWLKPQAYVGPVTGQFPCTSANGAPCADKGGCTDGGHGLGGRGLGGGLGGVGLGRGCNGKGTCVTPPDDAFSGYKFAIPESSALGGRSSAAVPSTSTSYKAQVSPTRMSPEAAPTASPKKPTVLESLKRSFSRQ